MTHKLSLFIVTLAMLLAACSTQQAPDAPAEVDSMAQQEKSAEEMSDESMEEEMDGENISDEAMDEDEDNESMDMVHSATITVRIENLSQSDSTDVPVLFAPGAWVVLTEGSPIFTAGEADRGLAVLGVHYPEFAFERDFVNLKKAIDELDVPYPVVQDNDRQAWDAYHVRYWPTLFLIDKEGRIRYIPIGEGRYDEIEIAFKALLAE